MEEYTREFEKLMMKCDIQEKKRIDYSTLPRRIEP